MKVWIRIGFRVILAKVSNKLGGPHSHFRIRSSGVVVVGVGAENWVRGKGSGKNGVKPEIPHTDTSRVFGQGRK